MTWGGPGPMFADWDQLDWMERRARRFARWLAAPGVEFVDDSAREAYRERVVELPFDVSHINTIMYDSIHELEERLRVRLSSIIAGAA